MPENWRQRAACRDKDTDTFYVSKDALRPPQELQELCASCPVRAACLLDALEGGEQGVWGGTTEVQRRILRRHYRRASCPGCGSDVVPILDVVQVCVACGLSWLATKIRTREGVRPVEGSARRGVGFASTGVGSGEAPQPRN